MDVAVIKNYRRPMLIGLKTDEIKNNFSFEPVKDQSNINLASFSFSKTKFGCADKNDRSC